MKVSGVRKWFGVLACMLIAASANYADPAVAEAPDEVSIGVMLSVGPEGSWDKTVIEALKRAQKSNPHGLKINYKLNDAVYGEKAEAVMQLLAKSGRYDIILSNSAHSDQIKNLRGKYPDIMWVSLGSGNYNTGENHYWYMGRVHQAGYLLGMLAAGMSKTGIVGVVGSFPAEDINDQVNAYRAGARAVKPDAKLKVSFIESWYDPPKAMEATRAQASAGADVIYQLAGEVYDACANSGILCLSKYRDTSSIKPEVVLSGTALHWDPAISDMLSRWVDHKSNETPFDSSDVQGKWFTMAEGGSDISPYNALEDKVPSDLKERVQQAKADIIAGKLEVELNLEVPTSDQ